jgi:hypothetical protein
MVTLLQKKVRAFIFLMLCSLMSYAQIPVDQWTRINQGFGKCTKIGESGPEAEWYRDNFTVNHMIWKKGEM